MAALVLVAASVVATQMAGGGGERAPGTNRRESAAWAARVEGDVSAREFLRLFRVEQETVDAIHNDIVAHWDRQTALGAEGTRPWVENRQRQVQHWIHGGSTS